METIKNEGILPPNNSDVLNLGRNDMIMNQAITQLEAAFDLGLAGLREYLNQLAPEDREKIILTISDSIKNY